MIIGIGTDVVQIPRIERLLRLYEERFVRRLLSEVEIHKMSLLGKSQYSNFLAKRFAAKEAVSKALGTGIGPFLAFQDISILNDSLGKPFVSICPTKYQQLNIHLSISDDYPVSIAFAVITTFNCTSP
jgi:holo-[acyl-carrier protein] synthase